MTHRNYTDKQQIEEFDGDWDDIVSPEEYEEILDRKRFNQSMGKPAWDGIRLKKDWFVLMYRKQAKTCLKHIKND